MLSKALAPTLLSFVLASYAPDAQEEQAELGLAGKLVCEATNELSIEFMLSNSSKSDVSIRTQHLPWFNDVSVLELRAIGSQSGVEILRMAPIRDVMGRTTLRGGESVSGQLPLSSQFDEVSWSNMRSREVVRVSWKWQLDAPGVRAAGTGGTVVIGRGQGWSCVER